MQDLLIDKYLLSFSTPILLQAAASSYVKNDEMNNAYPARRPSTCASRHVCDLCS